MSRLIVDIRNMTKEELGIKIDQLREEGFRLRYQSKAGRVEKPHRLRQIRRQIARCMTVLGEKDQQAHGK